MDNNIELFDKNGNPLSIENIIELLPSIVRLEKVNRVEVIDEQGRSYVNWDNKNNTVISFQDEGRTLKVFITDLPL